VYETEKKMVEDNVVGLLNFTGKQNTESFSYIEVTFCMIRLKRVTFG